MSALHDIPAPNGLRVSEDDPTFCDAVPGVLAVL
jgi:hypothetical protein